MKPYHSPAAVKSPAGRTAAAPSWTIDHPHIVLVLQGGGALGAYQAGVYEALHESGIEPHWIIGTSIGAINGALIAGNESHNRLSRLQAFWKCVTQQPSAALKTMEQWLRSLDAFSPAWEAFAHWQHNSQVVMQGIPKFFTPNPLSCMNPWLSLGVEKAAYYSTTPLRETLLELVDFEQLGAGDGGPTRLTVGAVNVRTGQMRYFDSRREVLGVDHVLASGALAPVFGAVRIDGDPYWDGGLYSNTPIEAVLDDKPRRHSLIFSAQMWKPHGPEPHSIWDIQGRIKDIQYASRSDNHIERQRQLHHLRHVIRELAMHIPEKLREDPAIQELGAWGCSTVMHIVQLNAAPLPGQDQTRDIDFTAQSVELRYQAGYADAMHAIQAQPWKSEQLDSLEGVFVHEVNP
ncbi:MAG TPA: patatin-like phospholipase family protein [Dyella sp.]|uniref:patatin-like phospholipase family protein n=1 Tax=Dyella sp. TaxID=1869338 RepID=UPI002CB3F3EF|nr:patatin-like phospholipase family protein [Dyella sp.]HTV85967.1 patatin-like phospholipase family protein [Dyella sp.]